MRTFYLPNGKTFESDYQHRIMPVVIGEIDQAYFDKENPIPQEYLEHVKENFNDAPIHYKKGSIYDEVENKLKHIVRYSIEAKSDDFPQYRPLSFLEYDLCYGGPTIERLIEITLRCETASIAFYVKHEIVNVGLLDLIESSLDEIHERYTKCDDYYEDEDNDDYYDDDDYYDIIMYDEAGWATPICINNRDELNKYLAGVRFVEEVK